MEACGAREVELDNEINSPEVYNDPAAASPEERRALATCGSIRKSCLPPGKRPWKSRNSTSRCRQERTNDGRRNVPMNPKRGSKTHEIALSGLLFALAMALSFVEGTLVIPGLMPGMKLGLANIVVMYALFFMGAKAGTGAGPAQGAVRLSGLRVDGGFPLPVRRVILAAGDVGAVLSFPGAAHLVHPLGLRRAGP